MKLLNIIITFFLSFTYMCVYKLDSMIKYPLINICALEKCPFCYGTDLCEEFKNDLFKLKINSLRYLIANLLSVKNVYYANFKNKSVVLKKLAHDFELDEFDRLVPRLYRPNWWKDVYIHDNFLKDNYKLDNFYACTNKTFKNFKEHIKSYMDHNKEDVDKQIWYTLNINVEPLLLQMLPESFPLPKYLGSCGRIVVEEDGGNSLFNFFYADWQIRANITLQLLKSAEMFTKGHNKFRFYLTDISPDNIVVDNELTVRFIDLENVVINDNTNLAHEGIHQSINVDDENGFGFFPNEICSHSISDHNYYAMCKLLLSRNAPWPMVTGGILHSAPIKIKQQFPELFELVEQCVHPNIQKNRLDIARELEDVLKKVLDLLQV